MRVAVDTEAADTAASVAGDTQVSAAEDTRVSAAVSERAELVLATAEPVLVGLAAAMARGITHPESQRDATALIVTTEATAATGKGITHREPRRGIRLIVLLTVRKAEPLPGSLLGRQSILVATTSHEINPLLALRANPASSNALAQLQRVQRGPTELGRDRMQPTGSDSTLKQRKDCVTGKAKRLDTPMQDVITRNTGSIASTMTMIGGVIIATLSFSLVGGFGAGMTAGGIRPGDTIRITPSMTTMVRSMVTMDFNQTR
jgi:hypothetical protein